MNPTCVVILITDRLYSDLLMGCVLSVCPEADCKMVQRVAQARELLASHEVALFVTSIETSDGDTLDLLAHLSSHAQVGRVTLVLTRRVEPRVVTALRLMSIGGVFDASNDMLENFGRAISEILNGRTYWSSSLHRTCHSLKSAEETIALLTPTERLVLALIGDGSDDKAASARIGMKPASVHAVRKSLHEKLHIQQKAELVNIAARYGFVRFCDSGLVPVGLGLLLSEYQTSSKRPFALSPDMAVKYPAAAEAAIRRRKRVGKPPFRAPRDLASQLVASG